MILHFYKLPTSFEMTYGLHWFYAKKNQSSEFIPPTGVDS